jgi:hypothetical protein
VSNRFRGWLEAKRVPFILLLGGGGYPRKVLLSDAVDLLVTHSNLGRCSMGDKSPKSKERLKKQDTTHKNQQKAAAIAKANPPAAGSLKSGK